MSRSAMIALTCVVMASVLLTTAVPADAAPGRRFFRAIGFAAWSIYDIRSDVAALQDQMDELREDMNQVQSDVGGLEAHVSAHSKAIDEIFEDITALTVMTDDLKVQMETTALRDKGMQEQIDANEAMIEMLKADVTALWLELATKGGGGSGECPPGSLVHEISDGKVLCEFDGIGDYTHVAVKHWVNAGNASNLSETCPSGRQVLMGGFTGGPNLHLEASWPNANRWQVSIRNTSALPPVDPTECPQTPPPLTLPKSPCSQYFIILRCARSDGLVAIP